MSTAVMDERAALIGLYAPAEPVFVSGEGSWLTARDGRRYLDFTAGIAVTALGHGAPEVVDAIRQALDTGLVHTSNLFRTEPAERLAEELVARAFPGRAFFCNSGAEAGEAAFKFARRWARAAGGPERHEVIAFRGAFHGRLFGTLAATDRPSYREPFEPLMPGVHFAEVGDVAGVEALLARGRVAAVVIEPVQGEGGVRPVDAGFLRALRDLCTLYGACLIFDEIQCGYGRTGDLFAFEQAGVTPDLLTLAKPMAGGLPMGAVVAAPHVADTLVPGDHGTTFGGGPLVASVARAVLRTVADPEFLAGVKRAGERLEHALRGLGAREVRGRGLMWGVVLDGPAAPVVTGARERGLLVCSAGPDVVRVLPPLTVSDDEIDHAVSVLSEVVS